MQFGEAMKWTDILGWTALLKVMEDGIDLMSENCALKADDLTLAALAHATTGGTKRYSGGATTYAALGALTTTTGKFTADDPLDAMTRLHVEQGSAHQWRLRGHHRSANRSRSHEGRDLGQCIHLLGRPAALQSGGWHALRGAIRITTNVWGEDATEGTRDTTPVAAQIWTSIFTGRDAYGVVSLSGESPYKPDVMICNEPDKSDPANQFTTATWKAFYQAAVLNQDWVVALRSKGLFTV